MEMLIMNHNKWQSFLQKLSWQRSKIVWCKNRSHVSASDLAHLLKPVSDCLDLHRQHELPLPFPQFIIMKRRRAVLREGSYP